MSTIDRISEFSLFALLERTYENCLSLDEMIKKLQKSDIDGVVGVSLYQKEKVDENVSFSYLSGFGQGIENLSLDEELLHELQNTTNEDVSYTEYTLKTEDKNIDTYRFIKPLIYQYQDENILLGVVFLYYDITSINTIIERSIEIILTSTLVILLIATLFAYYIGSRFTRPILEITEASESISKGDLNIHLNIQTNDEVENLAYHFNAMVEDLQERKKMQKFVSASTMDMIQKDTQQEMVLGGENRTLTILFSDIRNSTALSEEKSPSEVIHIVNFYLNLQANIIEKFGGDIDKFIGDEVMASFNGDDAISRALQCAIEIQATIQKENVTREKLGEVVCEVGIGINNGEVIVGNVGSEDRMDFTAVGLPVNIASRLCTKAKAGYVIIDKNTYNEGNCKYETLEEASFNVKGVSYPIQTYIISRKDV